MSRKAQRKNQSPTRTTDTPTRLPGVEAPPTLADQLAAWSDDVACPTCGNTLDPHDGISLWCPVCVAPVAPMEAPTTKAPTEAPTTAADAPTSSPTSEPTPHERPDTP